MPILPSILVADIEPDHPQRVVADLQSEGIAKGLGGTIDAVRNSAGHRFDFALVDPQVTDLQPLLQQLRRANPDIEIIVMADQATDENVHRAVSIGASSLVGKPVDVAEVGRVFQANPALNRFCGTVGEVPTGLLLHLFGASASDGIMQLELAEAEPEPRRGTIHLRDGQPIHASDGRQVGAPAVHEMLRWQHAHARWIPGRAECPRTILGRWEGLLGVDGSGSGGLAAEELRAALASQCPEVLEKLSRLAQTPDVLGAFLLHHRKIVTGRCVGELDQDMLGRALVRLAQVLGDIQQPDEPEHEIQATSGALRLVVDRVGPPEAGYQVGVAVRQASPVCKSLRRLLRQIARTFENSPVATEIGRSSRASLHRVA